MVTVVKSEWHQVEKRYGIEIDADILGQIYPDLDEDEIAEKLRQIEEGEIDFEEIVADGWENDIDLDWDYLNDDDWWTDRKGGYDITYSVEDWEVREDYVSPVTHKCTKCKWEGSKFDTDWIWPEDDETGEREAKKVCPMCESDTTLTEIGIAEEQKEQERKTNALSRSKDGVEDDEVDEDFEDNTAELEAALEDLKREFERLSVEEDPEDKKNV
jgi:hypothetical protein